MVPPNSHGKLTKKNGPGIHNILLTHRTQVFSQMPCVKGNGLPSCSHVYTCTYTDGWAGSPEEEVCRHKARSLCPKVLSNTYFLFHILIPESIKWHYSKMLSCDDPLWWMRYDWAMISHHTSHLLWRCTVRSSLGGGLTPWLLNKTLISVFLD